MPDHDTLHVGADGDRWVRLLAPYHLPLRQLPSKHFAVTVRVTLGSGMYYPLSAAMRPIRAFDATTSNVLQTIKWRRLR